VSAVPLGLALALVAAPAVAAPPTTWEPDDTSGLRLLTVIVLIPLAAIAVITLLTYLPSLVRGRSNEPAVAFQRRSEWFGGPRAGADAAVDQASGQGSESGKGGAGARW
jgi:hypothetical protein